jgi:hypothetical protein
MSSLAPVILFAPDLHVDAAAFLGAGALSPRRLRQGRRADAARWWPARRETRRQILIYTALLVPVALAPCARRAFGPGLWRGAVGAVGGCFVVHALRVWLRRRGRNGRERCSARRMFRFSLLYLFGFSSRCCVIDKAVGWGW